MGMLSAQTASEDLYPKPQEILRFFIRTWKVGLIGIQLENAEGYCPKRRDLVNFRAMKLNKPDAASAAEDMTPVTGGATIAARFQLDAELGAEKKAPAEVGKTSTLIALLAALAALALVGFAAWMMYSDWAVATVS